MVLLAWSTDAEDAKKLVDISSFQNEYQFALNLVDFCLDITP